MCSQYEIKTTHTEIIEAYPTLFTKSIINNYDLTNTHIYPKNLSPIILRNNGNNILKIMRYSLIPKWSKTSNIKFSTYNARLDRTNEKTCQLEFIYNSPTWKKPFATQHCVVPITSFFESCRTGTHTGNIVQFTAKNIDIMLVAGIWDTWTNSDTGDIINSFAILTDSPCDYILNVGHDRQPVFLSENNAQIWLDDKLKEPQECYSFLKNNQQAIEYSVSNYKQLKDFNKNDLFG